MSKRISLPLNDLLQMGYNEKEVTKALNDVQIRSEWKQNSQCSVYVRANKLWYKGEIIHIDDSVIVDGRIDIKKVDPLARLGYLDYARLDIDNIFSMRPPDDSRFDK